MPIGFLITLLLVAGAMLMALRPPARSGFVGVVAWLLSALPNESPFLAFHWLAFSTWLAASGSNAHGTVVWIATGLTVATFIGTPVVLRRSLRARLAFEDAFESHFGPGWRRDQDGRSSRERRRWLRIVLAPLPLLHPGVKRHANISYGDAGRRNVLDLYRRRSALAGPGPILIHLHGGGFSLAPGRKSFYARRMLFRLARQGWVCISPNYRLGSAGMFPNDVIDVKKVIAWARAHAAEYGGDPDRIVLAGSSYGARLATITGFTENDTSFQPGFEDVDTSVRAVVGLYGYYGSVDSHGLPSSPFDYADRGSPALLIVHGEQDTLTSAMTARNLADEAGRASADPVVYVELPGAQHSFDLLTSLRFELAIDGIETYARRIMTDPSLHEMSASARSR
jgi:acetyl esterase/lipase